MFRYVDLELEVFLVHPGGPYWTKKDEGAWSIPKGEYQDDESAFEAARREFREETGFEAIAEKFIELEPVRQPSRKIISAWAFQSDCDPSTMRSNTFCMEWPPKSGKQAEFAEVDRAGWFTIDRAKKKIVSGQIGLIEQLCEKLNYNPPPTKDNERP